MNIITLFVSLAMASPIARVLAAFLLDHLGQNAFAVLRIELSKLILRQPLRRLEELGLHRLLGMCVFLVITARRLPDSREIRQAARADVDLIESERP